MPDSSQVMDEAITSSSEEAEEQEQRALLGPDAEHAGAHDQDYQTRAREHSLLLQGFYAYCIPSARFSLPAVIRSRGSCANGQRTDLHCTGLPCPCTPSSRIDGSHDVQRCAVRLLGIWMDTGSYQCSSRSRSGTQTSANAASFSLFVYSASVTVQALLAISLGG